MKGERHAERHQSGQDVSSPETRGNGQGEGGADSPIENWPRLGDGEAAQTLGGAVAGASAPKQAYLNVTEANMKAALIEARGDIFIASQMLGITAIRLNRAIQVSQVLQSTVDTLPKLSEGFSLAQLDAAIESRLKLYRVSGLDALHDLATMPLDENSAQNQVKLAAAARLAGTPEAGGAGGEVADALRSLNDLYHQHAPRLRVVRERLTVEVAPGEKEVNPSVDQD